MRLMGTIWGGRVESSYLYFVEAKTVGLTKIGISDSPEDRLKNLDTASPVTLTLHSYILVSGLNKARALERKLHDYFASCRVKGEWFKLDAAEAKTAAEAMIKMDAQRVIRAAEPLVRCGAIFKDSVCEKELGHEKGFGKHRHEGVTWSDAGAERINKNTFNADLGQIKAMAETSTKSS